MTTQQRILAFQKGWLPLVLITVLTVAILIISIISLLSGWLTIFQNLFYFPIILACVYYVKRGFVFSVVLACGYFVLMTIFSQDPVVLQGAFIRVLIFVFVAGVVTYLSIIRIRAEEALRESEEFNRGLVENMPDLVVVYGHDRKIRFVNPAAIPVLGYSVEEMVGTNIMDYVVPRQRAEIAAAAQEGFSSGSGKSLEVELITRGNRQLTVMTKGVPLHFHNQPAVLVLIADITERKQAEEALQESERRLGEIINFLPDPTFAIDTTGTVIAWNRAIEELMGVSKADMLGKGDYAYAVPAYGETRPVLIDLILDRDAEQEKRYDSFTQKGDQLIAEAFAQKLHGGKGEYLWMIASPLYDRNGTITGAIESIRIVTEQKRAEEELRETRNYLESLISYANAPIIVWNPEFEITRFNHAFEKLTGRTDEKVLGKHLHILFPVESCNASMDEIRKALSGEQWEAVEIPVLNISTEEVRTVLWNSANILSHDGTKVIATIAQGQDITDRKHAEEAFKTANRKLNLLSSITRHDINNQLMVLQGYFQLLVKKNPDPALGDYFNHITSAGTRISAMIQFTKEYEKIGVNAPSWQDCRILVDTATKQAPLGKVMVKNDLPDGTEVFADPLVIKVFYNLIDNAVRYGQKITIIRFSVKESGDNPLVVCEDDGVGVPAEEKEKIFERGYGKNTGLGLFLSREILDITGITIRETGEPGKGARFEIKIPKGALRMTGTGG